MEFYCEICHNGCNLMVYPDLQWQQQQFEQQQGLFYNLLYTNHSQTFITYTPIYKQQFTQETQHHNTKRIKNIIHIIDPETNMEVNLDQNDIGIQTDNSFKPMTLDGHEDNGTQTDDLLKPLDRHDSGIQTDITHRLKNIGTQTLDHISYSCKQTVDAALGSSALKGERLLQRRKFKDDTTELEMPTLISNDIKLKSCLRKHSSYDGIDRKDTYIPKKKVSFNLPRNKKRFGHTLWKKARQLFCCCFNF